MEKKEFNFVEYIREIILKNPDSIELYEVSRKSNIYNLTDCSISLGVTLDFRFINHSLFIPDKYCNSLAIVMRSEDIWKTVKLILVGLRQKELKLTSGVYLFDYLKFEDDRLKASKRYVTSGSSVSVNQKLSEEEFLSKLEQLNSVVERLRCLNTLT